MRRILAAVACVLVPWCLGLPAGAEAPQRVGWWTASNLGAPVPTIGPLGPSGDVPDGGFEVAGSEESPTSVAALAYEVTDGARPGPLVLRLADGTTQAPGSIFQVCPLTDGSDFEAADGGPMSEAPEWDCAEAAVGTPDESGTAYAFDVGALVRGDSLAVAVVPASSGRAVFAPPGSDSLVVTDATDPSATATEPPPSSAAGSTSDAGIDAPSAAPVDPVVPPGVSFSPPALEPVAPPPAGPADAPSAPAEAAPAAAGSPPPVSATSGTPAGGGLGAGSAVVGSLLVLVAGIVVLLRSRRALEQALQLA